jgi:hypothetical protein
MSIRYTILKALHQHGAATLDELIDATGETRRRLQDNLAAALKDDLCERIRDDVTGQPAYRITKYGVARMNARNGITAAKSKPQPQPVEAPQAQPAQVETHDDEEPPPADPALLASANRMLGERLERVAHVLRGCGLTALKDATGSDDLQSATAALAGAYQMLLANTDNMLAKNTSLEDRLADTQSALDLMRTDRDKMLMENAGLVELVHTLKLENDAMQARIATLEGNLELTACSPDAASRNPGPSLGWQAIIVGKTYSSEADARQAAELMFADEPPLSKYGESIAVAKIVAIADPVVAVKWREAA